MKYYFEYNHAPTGDKYCIMTKAEYELAKRDPTRWFIDFGNCVIECSKAERTEYYRMYYRYFNSRKCKNGRDADMVSLNSVNEAVSYGMSVFAVHNEPTIDDIVICRMYAVVKGTDSELPALLAAWLSLRIGEVIGLQFQDVDLEKRQINVRRTIVMTEEGYMVRDGCKTEKSVRSIRVPDYILNLIQAQPHEAETDFIIPRTRKSVYSKFKRLMEKNGIDLTFHGLRHI